MAFSNTMTKKEIIPGGFVLEHGVYDGTAVTTGTITADTTTQPEITEILAWGASSDADDNSLVCATDAALNKLKLTFASGDSGKYWFIGKGK